MAYINIIQHNDADGELKSIYDGLVKTRGKLAEVHKIQSLNPGSIQSHMDLYMTIMFSKSPLKRYKREMMAVVVSAANKCEYCITHHGEALNHFWKDEDRVTQLANDFKSVSLEPQDFELCRYAYDLTLHPENVVEADHIAALRDNGIEERALLDANLVISYFNFVNRIVTGLGVDLEADGGKGYDYD